MLQNRRSVIQDNDVELTDDERFQVGKQVKPPLRDDQRIGSIGQQNRNVDIGARRGAALRERAEQLGDQDIRLFGQECGETQFVDLGNFWINGCRYRAHSFTLNAYPVR